MTRLAAPARPFSGWVGGLVQDAEPGTLPAGAIAEGENLVPLPAGLQRTRGGSRILLTLHDDAGSPAELTHVCMIAPYSPLGAVAIGYSDGQNKHYAYRLTADGAFTTGLESTSRHDLVAATTASWNNASTPARPVAAELYEKLFVADAATDQTARNKFFSMTSAASFTTPTFAFAGGSVAALLPYCLEEYNGVLFLAGYGDEGDKDRPEMLRHSFLAKSPDAADGFDANAYLLLGAKGQRVTALRKGRGLLLAAKNNEFYRITGFGRAYPGWQYTVENVQNTLGLGVSNPNGLVFAEGHWYGIGTQGPLRTDGYTVESLAGPRQRGWRAIDNVNSAWVAYHPERRLILFGVHPLLASAGRSTTYPWTVWTWDLEREVWQTDWKFGADLFVASAIPPAGGATSAGPSAGPTADPSAPVSSLATASGYTASWTNGDATAQTEVWEKEGLGGTWALVTSVAAGVATYPRTTRTSHTAYYWRVRHRKGGITSNYTADTIAQTLIAAPTLAANIVNGLGQAYVNIFGEVGTVHNLEQSPVGAGTWTELSAHFTGGWQDVDFDYRARSTDGTWSVSPSVYSATLSI